MPEGEPIGSESSFQQQTITGHLLDVHQLDIELQGGIAWDGALDACSHKGTACLISHQHKTHIAAHDGPLQGFATPSQPRAPTPHNPASNKPCLHHSQLVIMPPLS